MAISLETLRLPASLRPSRSTITRSEVRIIPLLMEVGVTRTRLRSRRTERLPSVPATNPHPCSIPPSWIISFRYWRWLAIFKNTPSLSLARSEEHTSELQSHSDLVCRLLLEKKNRPESPSQSYPNFLSPFKSHYLPAP